MSTKSNMRKLKKMKSKVMNVLQDVSTGTNADNINTESSSTAKGPSSSTLSSRKRKYIISDSEDERHHLVSNSLTSLTQTNPRPKRRYALSDEDEYQEYDTIKAAHSNDSWSDDRHAKSYKSSILATEKSKAKSQSSQGIIPPVTGLYELNQTRLNILSSGTATKSYRQRRHMKDIVIFFQSHTTICK